MNLLVINPNTSTAMTAKLEQEARRVAPPGTAIAAITVPYGPKLLTRRSDVCVGGAAVLSALEKYTDVFDAVVVGSISDPGVSAAREMLNVPVVGCGETSILMAMQLGARIGMLMSAPSLVPAIEENLRASGIYGRLCGISCATIRLEKDANFSLWMSEIGELAAGLVSNNGAEVIILGGGPLIGLKTKLQSIVPVPVIDAIECSVLQAWSLCAIKTMRI